MLWMLCRRRFVTRLSGESPAGWGRRRGDVYQIING
jgi:hypothetical protein